MRGRIQQPCCCCYFRNLTSPPACDPSTSQGHVPRTCGLGVLLLSISQIDLGARRQVDRLGSANSLLLLLLLLMVTMVMLLQHLFWYLPFPQSATFYLLPYSRGHEFHMSPWDIRSHHVCGEEQ